jgi:FHS family glucose/mannose:H+ symporter-like MFS transporter
MLEAVALRFHVILATAGTLVGIHFLGALIGAASFWQLRNYLPAGRLLGATYGILAIGFATVIFASAVTSFPLLCGGVLAGGIGFGGLDYGLSQIFATCFGARKTQMLNLLHGTFGVGTTLGPLALGLIGPSRYPAIFAGGFLIALAGLVFGRSGHLAQLAGARKPHGGNTPLGYPLLSCAAFLFVALYLVHVAVQGSIGEWEPAQLRALGFHAESASLWTAAYWSGIAGSRLGIAYGRLKWSPRRIVISCCVGTCLTAGLTFVPAARPIDYVIFGLCIGPIFPVGLSWLSAILRHPDNGIAAVVITSLIGGVIFPPSIGLAMANYGVGVLPVALLILSLCATAMAWMLPGQYRGS